LKTVTRLSSRYYLKNKDEFIRIWNLAVVKGLTFEFKEEI
jgi:hypothetical protein